MSIAQHDLFTIESLPNNGLIKICAQCGELFHRPAQMAQQNWDRLYRCSRECSIEWRKDNREPKYSSVYFNVCVDCGVTDVSRQQRRVNRCYTCAYKHHDRIRRINSRSTNIAVSCKQCGILFTPLNTNLTTCSDTCSNRLQRGKHYTHKRRAKHYGVKYEPVNRIDIFNRDDWTCKGCGCDTPRNLIGTLDDNAPELDHFIPISKGGDHVESNLQCLCRICNSLKGNTDNDTFLKYIYESKG